MIYILDGPEADLETPLEAAPEGVKTLRELLEQLQRTGALAAFKVWAASLPERSGLDLRSMVETASSPEKLWALHMALQRRGVPPVLRGARPTHLGRQGRFIEVCADVVWLMEVWGHHRPRRRLARAIFDAERSSDSWWSLVRRLFGRSGDTRALVLALDLPAGIRVFTRTMLPATHSARFDRLHGEGFSRLRDALEASLRARPDLSGRTRAADVALRRAQLWRTYRLAGGGPTGTARQWAQLSGEQLSRQAVANQLEAARQIATALERGRAENTENAG